MRRLLLILLIATGCSAPRAPIGFWSRNRNAPTGERHGPWIGYFDAAEMRLAHRGHYRHGRPVGRWRYYTYHGTLDHDERYRRRGELRIRHFHANGRIAQRGSARLVSTADTVHYYWYGLWQLYDSTGRHRGWELYDKGHRMAGGLDDVRSNRRSRRLLR